MITINKIDFSRLKPYNGKVTKCFEQLCYQIAQKEFGHLGKFTPIDGSGGDGGVEFYLTLHNGEKWGWQCKFYGDNGRLNISSRDVAIEGSLETACRNHTELKRWFLCLKTDLTTDSLSPRGKFSEGENNWFRSELPKKIPIGMSVELEHWGESSLITFLNDSKHIGIRSFFFGELEFNHEWFEKRFQENFEKVKDKFDPQLHSMDKYTKSLIDFLLLDPNYAKLLDDLKNKLFQKSNEIQSAIKEFANEKMIKSEDEIKIDNYVLYCNEFKKHIAFIISSIDIIKNGFETFDEDNVYNFSIKKIDDDFEKNLDQINDSVFDNDSRLSKDASNIIRLMYDFRELYNQFFRNYYHKKIKELHFLGDAAKGKTHLSCSVAYNYIKNQKAALFITGDKFTDETSIIDTIRKNLDIDTAFTFDEFLSALDTYGAISNSKIPIIIDALNETTFNRYFSPIWKNHLHNFILKVISNTNLVVITTSRNSYVNRIWGNRNNVLFNYLNGFDDHETIKDAVNKYFTKYKLKATLFFAPLEKFRDPIFLKIFCEIKNPDWALSGEVEVNVEEESSFDTFKEYLSLVNHRVTLQSHLLRENEPFISTTLKSLSKYLWDKNLRELNISDFYDLIDGPVPYQKDNSKADILINEGLVVSRDVRADQEYISFTYDVMAGYLISQYLIDSNDNLRYFISEQFINKIIQEEGQHPLYEDVVISLCTIMPQLKNVSLHELIDSDKKLKFVRSKVFKLMPGFIKEKFTKRIKYSDYTFSQSVTSLFSLPSKLVKKTDQDLVLELFGKSENNKKVFFDLSFKTIGVIAHPLNAIFLGHILSLMSMSERDLAWTEYIRKRFVDLQSFISEFESQCMIEGEKSQITIQKQHVLANIIVWMLTSTNRTLRDSATRALYFYGIKFSNEFSQLVYESLGINDPYVSERMLAALYGITMAKHNSLLSSSFRDEIMPSICKKIYSQIFKKGASFGTTHILTRDYARRIIEVGLLHDSNLLSAQETEEIRPPYKFGGIRNLGEHDYGEREYDYSGPIQMDFSNYTIGGIVKDGNAYANPLEKQKVRRQIYWRIYDLGWNENLFKDAERALGNDSSYNGRAERPKVERYGKKYSWIAFFENAGLREDLGLLDDQWNRFRISDADIDPSFPIKPVNKKFITHDLLGDRSSSLIEWYKNGGVGDVDKYLEMEDLDREGESWICIDAFVVQEDIPAERERFNFIRGLFIKNDEYDEAFGLLKNQKLGSRWLPEIKQNYYTFAGELYYCDEATNDNSTQIGFLTKTEVVKVKTKEGLYQRELLELIESGIVDTKNIPEEIERKVNRIKDFNVLLPVMEYSWEGYHSVLNNAGPTTVVSKEIAKSLNLVEQPQTFELLDENGKKASLNFYHDSGYNNNHGLVYLRKDLMNKFLSENNLKFVWALWGERDVSFKTEERRISFFSTHPFTEHQTFQNIIEYKE
ncbi:hypothetical protein ACI6Q2_11740 [Chitinophagaceae bacterium LWZ2-11]